MRRINLNDTTFLVLVRVESIERIENLLASVDFLLKQFDTNILIWECSSYNNNFLNKLLKKEVSYKFIKDHDTILYRTRYLNKMTLEAVTPFLAIWDVDVIIPEKQIIKSIDFLRTHEADIVYPYTKYFLDTSDIIRQLYLESRKLKVLMDNRNKMKAMYSPNPVGGAFFCNRSKYIESGMENEKFYGWGFEDGERYVRFEKLNYKIKQIEGPLFHLSHPRGLNSDIQHADQQLIKMREGTFSSHIQTINNEYE